MTQISPETRTERMRDTLQTVVTRMGINNIRVKVMDGEIDTVMAKHGMTGAHTHVGNTNVVRKDIDERHLVSINVYFKSTQQ